MTIIKITQGPYLVWEPKIANRLHANENSNFRCSTVVNSSMFLSVLSNQSSPCWQEMDMLRNEMPKGFMLIRFWTFWQEHNQDGVHIQFGDQKLPRGFMPMKFWFSVLVLCSVYNKQNKANCQNVKKVKNSYQYLIQLNRFQ